jgi:peptide/nickel transport system permease protein
VLTYIVKRLFWGAVSFIVLTLATYVLFFQIPADPARFVVRNPRASEEQLAQAREKLGLDDPVLVQYGRYLWRLAHLDFGESFESRPRDIVPVRETVVNAAGVSLSLIVGGAVLVFLIAIPLGLYSAVHPKSGLDRAGLVFVLIGVSLHPIVLGLLFRQFLGFKWQLMPVGEYCPLVGTSNPTHADIASCGGPADWLHHLILPWLTFAFLFAALYSRMIRASALDVLGEQYVRVARAKGAPERRVLRRHVFRNAMLPVVTMIGMDLGVAFGSAVFVERVFHLPGLGSLSVAALRGEVGFDLPIVVGVVVFVSAAIIVLNLIVDLIYPLVDPRIMRG